MQGIEKVYCDVAIGAAIDAYYQLMTYSAQEALDRVEYGKGDTMAFDAIPEISIKQRIHGFDSHAILVTEELESDITRRWPTDSDRVRQPLMFFSDPVDRSKQLFEFLRKLELKQRSTVIGRLMGRDKGIRVWERLFERPASITGSTISITCVRKGEIVFSVILNFISHTIVVATQTGIFHMSLPAYTNRVLHIIDLDYIVKHGRRLEFLSAKETCQRPDHFRRFVTFLGTPEKTGYRENFRDSAIFVDRPDQSDRFLRFLHHNIPGGPARVLYLSELQRGHGPIGFIMANGEKISEWIHWLAFAKFARNHHGDPSLRVFEVATDRPWIKEGILMSTRPAYSIFAQDGDLTYLDVSRLRNYETPSRFRSMLVITPWDNERIISVMYQRQYREIALAT